MLRRQSPGLLVAAVAALALAVPAAEGAPGGGAPGRWIVRFESPSLVRAAKEGVAAVRRLPGGRLDLGDPAARDHLDRLDAEHARFRRELARSLPGAAVEREYRLLFNGAAVRTARPDLLRGLPGVDRLFPAEPILYRPFLDASLDMIGAPDLWEAAGGAGSAGAGIRIAVIDSGIDVDNPFFDPAGMTMPAGYPVGAAAHTTAKVIAARAYFRSDDPVDATLDEPNPRDHIGHGSHCAGIAAGRAGTVFDVNGTPLALSGVAPAAYLMSYKVFYRAESGTDGAYDAELMAAFEDAVADGADVISCSWGGPDPLLEVASAEVYRAAVDAGAVVVFAAGNDGSGPGTVSYPGALAEVLTVGSFDTGRDFAGRAELAADGLPHKLRSLPAIKGAISPGFADAPVGPLPLRAAAMLGDGANVEGCSPFFLDAFLGSAALISRGTCPFSDKVRHAMLAGAEAVVVYNDAEGQSAVVMGGEPVVIPAVQIGNVPGGQLVEWMVEHPDAEVEVELFDVSEPYRRPEEERRTSSFSARGPTDRPLLKPEIAAPGRAILSADAHAVGEDGPDWGVKQGTSMATPHVAGAAAVLRGLHPEAGPREIEGLIVGSARLDIEGDAVPSCFDTGAGQLDLARAAEATAGAVPAALSFGGKPQGERFEGTLQLFDLAGDAGGSRTVAWIHAHPDCTVEAPLNGAAVEPGDLVDLAIDCPPSATPGEYTGWMLLAGEGPDVVVPYHYRVLPPGNRELLLLDLSFPAAEASPLEELYRGLAEEEGLDFDSYRVVAEDGPPELSYLLRFATILAFTGDDQVGFRQQAGWHTLDLLSSYANGGGNLILAGQGPLRGADHPRLGGLVGSATHPGYPLFDPYTLDLLVLESYVAWAPAGEAAAWGVFDLGPGAGGQGELTLLGELVAQVGSGLPAVLSRPVLSMNPEPFAAGGVVAMVFDPYAGYGDFAGLEEVRHRAAVLGFGLERVGDSGSGTANRRELFAGLHAWVSERIDLSLEVEHTGGHVLVDAVTGGAEAVEYVFDFGDGSEPLVSGYHQQWHEYDELGEKTITVVVRAALGAADLETVSVELTEEPPPAEDPDGGADGGPVPVVGGEPRIRDCSCGAVGAVGGAGGLLVLLSEILI